MNALSRAPARAPQLVAQGLEKLRAAGPSKPAQARAPASAAAPGLAHGISPATPHQANYTVPRNSLGSLPVYTDVKHNGQKRLVLIRNVEGNATALAHDLKASLLHPNHPDASRLTAHVMRGRHIILSSPSITKYGVMNWLKTRGF